MSILTLPVFEDYIRNKVGAEDSAFTAGSLAAAEAALNSICQRQWVVASATTARVYVPAYAYVQPIHDCTAVSSVVVDGTTIDPSSYQLQPLNSVGWDGTALPYDGIFRLSGGVWYPSIWGKATMTVTATWGWAAIPAQITEACKILGRGIIEVRNARGGVLGQTDFGNVKVPRDIAAQVRSLIAPFRRAESFGIA